MAEASPMPRSFVSKALEPQHVDYLIKLDKSLNENPLDYYSHVSFVTVLHQGFEYHVASVDPANPYSYELLPVLREAYQTMAEKYPLGEVLWEYRLNDEKALAMNIEDRVMVLEHYKQATSDEPYSAKIWSSYGEYVSHLISCAWEQVPPEQWSNEDKGIGRELFNPPLLLDVWKQGADKTKYSLQDSSIVWDQYLQFLRDDLHRSGLSHDKLKNVMAVFTERLGHPHATWANTLSSYASFVSSVNGDPEIAMEQAVQQNTHIKQQYANREDFEFKLLQTIQQGDRDAEYHALTRYLKWEKKTLSIYGTHLVDALYERATLRFPVDPSLWEDHIEFLIWQQDRSIDLLNVVERATQHCPWSGSLWSHRLLTLEAEQRRFSDIEGVKHTATNTGLLEHNDIEELIKVQMAWCGYLRRKAFDALATEDDGDIAEVGIRSALEHVREVGMKKYGRDWPGDPKYRLERIHIKFWLQRGNVEEARSIWDALVPAQQDSYDFWYRYYIWEMVLWANHAVRDQKNAGQHLLTPAGATAVLERAMQRIITLDMPEHLIEMYVNHCEQHEGVLKVRSAQIERRRSERTVSIRRQKEAEAAAANQPEVQTNHVAESSGKRKREDALEDSPAKKSKQLGNEEAASTVVQRAVSEVPSNTGSTTQKRDREHASIIVQRLPQNTTQIDVRKFFSDAGNVRDVSLKLEKHSVTAFVEFETPEEAEYAMTKEAKGFEGNDITIKRSESTTLYVANYPPHADEAFLRKLFDSFGEILGLRFPSLKFDTHRRFCYIQFANADNAIAATKLDNTDLDGRRIIAKISNPDAKKKRDGAAAEGREIYVRKISFRAKKSEIQEAFAPFGKIERVNIPTLPNGNNKGFGYIVYESKECAGAAVAGMNEKTFWGLPLQVQTASDRTEAKSKVKSVIENATPPTERDSTPASDAGALPYTGGTVADRSIALLNLPDTVNDARVKLLVDPYGYKKITLMPQHGGAIIEFPSVEASGKAEISLQGQDFEGRKLVVGTVQALKKQKGEYKATSNFLKPTNVKRPAPAARGGMRGRGRPGLGYRAAPSRDAAEANHGEAKSNQDFRAMLLGKKETEVQDVVKEG
jgi:RNA recognition motif-containing protein